MRPAGRSLPTPDLHCGAHIVYLRIFSHFKGFVIGNEGIPIMAKVKFFVGFSCVPLIDADHRSVNWKLRVESTRS